MEELTIMNNDVMVKTQRFWKMCLQWARYCYLAMAHMMFCSTIYIKTVFKSNFLTKAGILWVPEINLRSSDYAFFQSIIRYGLIICVISTKQQISYSAEQGQ